MTTEAKPAFLSNGKDFKRPAETTSSRSLKEIVDDFARTTYPRFKDAKILPPLSSFTVGMNTLLRDDHVAKYHRRSITNLLPTDSWAFTPTIGVLVRKGINTMKDLVAFDMEKVFFPHFMTKSAEIRKELFLALQEKARKKLRGSKK